MTADPKEPNIRDPRDELPEHLPALRAFAISLCRNALLKLLQKLQL